MADLMESSAAGGPAAAAAQFGLQQLDKTVSYYQQKNLNRQAQAYTQKNMHLAHNLNYRATVDQTNAMRMAGINPAMALAGNFSATGVSNPAGTASAAPAGHAPDIAPNFLAMKEIGLADAQKANIEASTKLQESAAAKNYQDIAESETRLPLNSKQLEVMEQQVQKYGSEILLNGQEFGRMVAADSEANRLIKQSYDYRASIAKTPSERDYWLALKEAQGDLNVGTLRAMRDFSAYVNDLDEYDKNMLLRQLQKQIAQMQLDDTSVLYDLAHMPEEEFKKLMAETADLYASRDLRKAYVDVGIPAESEYKKQMAKTMRHNDFVGNMSDGNYFDAGMSQIPNLLSLFENALMLRYLRGGMPSGSQLPSGRPKGPFEAIDGPAPKKGLASNGKPALSDAAAESWARIQKLRTSDPEAYYKAVEVWQKKYGKK